MKSRFPKYYSGFLLSVSYTHLDVYKRQGRLFALLGVDRLEHFCHNFDLGFGHNRENVAVEMHRAALVFGVRKHLAHGLQHPHALVADDELPPFRPRPRSHWKKLTQLALSSFMPSAAPKTSRKPSSFTAIATRIATFSYSCLLYTSPGAHLCRGGFPLRLFRRGRGCPDALLVQCFAVAVGRL